MNKKIKEGYESPSLKILVLTELDVIRTSGDIVEDEWNGPTITKIFE